MAMAHKATLVLVLLALALNLLPAASCMGFGRACCCDRPLRSGDEAGTEIAESGCTCTSTAAMRGTPDARPADSPDARTHLVLGPSIAFSTHGGSKPIVAIAAPPGSLTAAGPPIVPPPAFLCPLRI
jgi:hypothetical protein